MAFYYKYSVTFFFLMFKPLYQNKDSLSVSCIKIFYVPHSKQARSLLQKIPVDNDSCGEDFTFQIIFNIEIYI